LGWALGLAVSAMILRYGLGAEELAWAAIFLVAPVSGVYYPIAVLPPALQAISWAVPPAYVFEGMRAVLLQQTFRVDYFRNALLLDAAYVAAGAAIFAVAVHSARKRGTLLQMGGWEKKCRTHRHPRRPPAQPEEPVARSAAARADRRHRRV